MKKLITVLLSVMAVISACKKFEFEDQEVVTNKEEVRLFTSNSNQKSNNIVRSNDTVYGNVDYYFSFWLTPAGVRGNFTITDSTGSIIYNQSNNTIDWLAPHTGTYTLNVIGDTFGFTNITINVTGAGITPPNPPGPYAGPRLYNLIVNDSTVSVDIVITKEEYCNASSSYSWFWLYRVNNLNFKTKLLLTAETTDSVYFTIIFPRVSGTIIEFNAGLDDGTTGGTWLTPSAYSGPLPGSNGNPFSYSNSYFGFKFIVGSNWEIQSIGGTTILSITNNLPGASGDYMAGDYMVRSTGLNYFIKTTASVVRYKVGNGSWNYISMTNLSYNTNYMTFSFPTGISGQVYFQWGTGTSDATFSYWTTEMAKSKFFVTNLNCCAKNL